ncbi:MAG: YraN family protein [Roseobacter sp.]
MSFHAGVAAEQAVARHYERLGFSILEQRWRGQSGEIDLIAQENAQFVFVEVKKSNRFSNASGRIGPAQQQRIFATATEFVTHQPSGVLSEMRFDVALVNAHGEIQVIENALHAD